MDEEQGISKAKPIPETITERVVVTAVAHCANCTGMLRRMSNNGPWTHVSDGSEVCPEVFRYER